MVDDAESTRIDRFLLDVRILESQNKFQSAIDLCQAKIGEWPEIDHHYIYGSIAYINTQMGNIHDGMTAANKAVELNSNYLAHLERRMMLAIKLGDFELAFEDATRLIDIERQRGTRAFSEWAMVYRSYALIKLGSPKQALQDLDNVKDQGFFWIEGRCWSRDDLIELANSRIVD